MSRPVNIPRQQRILARYKASPRQKVECIASCEGVTAAYVSMVARQHGIQRQVHRK